MNRPNQPDGPSRVTRTFLGWDRPVLHSAVAELVRLYRTDDALDFGRGGRHGRTVVVVPGQRVGRRLRELLVDAADREGLLLTPPEVATEGHLPELLYRQARPFASALETRLAWMKAVRALSGEALESIVPFPPRERDPLHWLRIGDMLGRVDAELAADGLEPRHVLAAAAEIEGFADRTRWQALRAARGKYHDLLGAVGLWDKHAARLKAVENGEVDWDGAIVLLGVVDPNGAMTAMLGRVAGRVTAFVAAPEGLADRFDAFGRLKAEAWKAADVPLRCDQISFVDGSAEQAAEAVDWLAGLGGKYAVEEVAVGVPDPALVPRLRQRLGAVEPPIAVRWVEERKLSDTCAYRLLATAADYATGRGYGAFAALLRHPDVQAWLRREGIEGGPADLDAFHGTHLPVSIDEKSLPEPVPRGDRAKAVRPAVGRIGAWLADLKGPHTLCDWADVFRSALKEIYSGLGDLSADRERDRILNEALGWLLAELDDLRKLPATLDFSLAATDAFAAVFEPLANEPLPPPADPGALELLGWLELPLDDAPAVLVTSFNDGFVPSSTGADPFLPDDLRKRLGVENDDRRYARDAYAVAVLAATKERFGCVVARRDAEQDPLPPSRLLFACPEKLRLARADRWLKSGHAGASVPTTVGSGPAVSPFDVPAPRPKEKRSSFRVTEFRDFLACPYRYYLRHVEGLTAVDDAARELDGAAFGDVLHKVMEGWGNDEGRRKLTDAGRLATDLEERLTAVAAKKYGIGRPAVQLQLLQARKRLRAFAKAQVALAEGGWRVVWAERDKSAVAVFRVDKESVNLLGRIDRIDYHEGSNAVRIIDYKTADKPIAPDKVHRKNGEWIDLQLPLYRHLWRPLVAASDVPETARPTFAYFQIPRKLEEVAVDVAEWDGALLDDADAVCRNAIREIQAGRFPGPRHPAPDFCEDLAAICLDNRMEPRSVDEENGEDEE